MAIIAGHAIGLFGAVWALFCVMASILVTDTLLDKTPAAPLPSRTSETDGLSSPTLSGQ